MRCILDFAVGVADSVTLPPSVELVAPTTVETVELKVAVADSVATATMETVA